MRSGNDSASGVTCEYRSSTVPISLIVGYTERVRPLRDHRLPPLAVAGRDLGPSPVRSMWLCTMAAPASKHARAVALISSGDRGRRVGAVDGRFEDDRGAAGVAHRPADGRTTRPTLPASVRAPSTRIGVPLTSTWRMPVGWSAVSRSASAGKSRTRRSGPGATVSGSNTHDVGAAARRELAAVGEAEHVGLLAGELAHRLLERHRRPRRAPSCRAGRWAAARRTAGSTCAPASDRPSAHVLVRRAGRPTPSTSSLAMHAAEPRARGRARRARGRAARRAASTPRSAASVGDAAGRPARGARRSRRSRRSSQRGREAGDRARARPSPAPATPDRVGRACARRSTLPSARRRARVHVERERRRPG